MKPGGRIGPRPKANQHALTYKTSASRAHNWKDGSARPAAQWRTACGLVPMAAPICTHVGRTGAPPTARAG